MNRHREFPANPHKPTTKALDLPAAPKFGELIRTACSSVQLHGNREMVVLELTTKDGLYNRAEAVMSGDNVKTLIEQLKGWIERHES